MIRPTPKLMFTPAPVVLVPGLGGSILINRERPDKYFFGERIINNRWISADMIHPTYHKSWSREIEIAVRRDEDTNKIIGFESHPDIIPYGFGGLRGVQNVAPELCLGAKTTDFNQSILDRFFNHRYFGPLIHSLQSRKMYVTSAPYDFRIILDSVVRADYWQRLRVLIEKTVYKIEKPVVLVAHSQGAAVLKWFLHDCDPYWARTNIHTAILINCPFGGSPQAVRTVLKGAFYLPILEHVYHKHVEINSGVVMGLPNSNAYSPEELFWESKDGLKIRLQDIPDLPHVSRGFEVWRDLFQPYTETLTTPPPIPIHMYVSTGIPTERVYKNDEITMTSGDGIIPEESLMAFRHAANIIQVPRVNHSAILQSKQLAHYIYSIACAPPCHLDSTYM